MEVCYRFDQSQAFRAYDDRFWKCQCPVQRARQEPTRQTLEMLRTTILLITLPLAASAQSTQQQSHGSASPSKVTPIYSRVPFDINATQLPAHFKGHDIALLYRAFQRIESVDKSEYETTERFNERVATLTLKPVIGTISAKSTLAFVALDLVADYDADHELLTAGVRGSFSSI